MFLVWRAPDMLVVLSANSDEALEQGVSSKPLTVDAKAVGLLGLLS